MIKLDVAAICMSLVVTAMPLLGQKPEAARAAGKWFVVDRETYIQRSGAKGMKQAIDLWEVSAPKAIGDNVTRADLFLLMPKFSPLWTRSKQLAPGAAERFAKRLQQVPPSVVQRWHEVTGADLLYAAVSLTAENALFPDEKYNEQAFRKFVRRFE